MNDIMRVWVLWLFNMQRMIEQGNMKERKTWESSLHPPSLHETTCFDRIVLWPTQTKWFENPTVPYIINIGRKGKNYKLKYFLWFTTAPFQMEVLSYIYSHHEGFNCSHCYLKDALKAVISVKHGLLVLLKILIVCGW